MKRLLFLIVLFCCLPLSAADQLGIYQHGTVVRMRMGSCAFSRHGFMASFGGPQGQLPSETCPEYTLLSDKVVYVIVGTSPNQLIPLADVIDFRIHKGELAVRIDDARHETRFSIREMMLRSEYDVAQRHVTNELSAEATEPNNLLTVGNR